MADKVVLEGNLRYSQDAVRRDVVEGLRQGLSGLAQGTGAALDLTARAIYPILNNDPQLCRRAVDILQQILGPKRLLQHQPAMGSEDFSYYAAQAPAFYFFLGVRPPGSKGQSLHSPEFKPDGAALPWGLKAAAGLLAALSENTP